ncbi:MAG: arylsulfatase [Verrucomicrobiota bacterium JB023]|nr:arylsulfatase [Verrucomicrobiota bacterium JB023]
MKAFLPILKKHLVCLALFGAVPAVANEEKPNIVFIFADDMGIGDVHAYNPERGLIETPAMDQMAAEGMLFTDAHTSSSVCTPSRYSLMTGRYSWRSRLQRSVIFGFGKPLIPTSRLTVAGLLKEQGYETAMVGKWHIGMDFPPGKGMKNIDWKGEIKGGPADLGFDSFFGISASLDMPPYIYIEDDRFVGECTTTKTFHKQRHGPAHADLEAVDVLDDLLERSQDYIQERQPEKPFFLYIALPSPHTPIVPSEKWRGRSELGPYGDFMMQTDDFVGQVMKSLDENGLSENTLLIVSSDNGCSAGPSNAEKLIEQGHYPSAQYRGYKSDLWEGGHRVPFIVKWPAKIKAGTRSDETICLTDFMATCADLTGATLPPNAGEDSVSFLPAFTGKTIETSRKGIIHHSIRGEFSYRKGKWKLLLADDSGGWSRTGKKITTEGQLYNLEKDPGETENLYAAKPKIVEELLADLKEDVRRGRSTAGPEQANDVENINLWKGRKGGKNK